MAATPTFFIPRVEKKAYEASYTSIIAAIKHQFNWPVTERRIQSLTYLRGKKTITARVGEQEHFEDQYQVVAIFESNLYIVATRTPSGKPGPTVLVGLQEVTEVIEF